MNPLLAGVLMKAGGGIAERLLGPVADVLGKEVGGGLESLFNVRNQLRSGALDFLQNALTWPFKGMKFPNRPFHPVGCNAASTEGRGLSTNGRDTIDTGRYLIKVEENKVRIYDKQTKTWVEAKDDPHMSTSDGDRGQFHENLTIDLKDGTKITIKTTPKAANGTAWIDAVAVMKGDQAIVVGGMHDGKAGVRMGHVHNNAARVDAMWQDGTVLRAGHEVDDLFYATGGEFRGNDPTQRFGEINLDGRGGVSRNSPDRGWRRPHLPPFLRPPFLRPPSWRPPVDNGGVEGTQRPTRNGGGSIFDRLWALISKLQKNMEKKLEGIEKKADKLGEKAGDDFDLKKDFAEIQRLQDSINQLITTATNIQKKDDESKSAIIRNFV